MKNSITNSYINGIGTLNTTFPDLLHNQLTLYITVEKQGGCKTGRFTTVVFPTSLWKTNLQTPGLSVITSFL